MRNRRNFGRGCIGERKGDHAKVVRMWLTPREAFAKLYRSYGAIEAGLVHEALADLTGGLGEAGNSLKAWMWPAHRFVENMSTVMPYTV